MLEYLQQLEFYWEARFAEEGRIWGETPSNSARLALERFREAGVRRVLVYGAGYGRHTELFAEAGIDVTGVEISTTACTLAQSYSPRTRIVHGSALEVTFPAGSFDAIYCYNMLHLLRAPERQALLDKCYVELRPGGLCVMAVFSEQEETFGHGAEVEPHTFESKPGRPVHYFTRDDLLAHFAGFALLEERLIDDPEDHGETGPHTHRLRYIVAQKPATAAHG